MTKHLSSDWGEELWLDEEILYYREELSFRRHAERLVELAEAIKNDDGHRFAFVRVANSERQSPYDNRMYYMVQHPGEKGKRLTIIDDRVLPKRAVDNPYYEGTHEEIGTIDIYADKIGYVSPNNSVGAPHIPAHELQAHIDAYYLRDVADDPKFRLDLLNEVEQSAKKAHLLHIEYEL